MIPASVVSVDLAEINHKPMPARSPGGDHTVTASLKSRIEELETQLAKSEASAACHRADFERERERCDRHIRRHEREGKVGTAGR
jgi:hypothetical protein